MVRKQLAENLAVLRKAKGVTQQEAANAVGISDKTLSKWENALSAPDIEYILPLADYYEVSVDALLGSKYEFSNIPGQIGQYLSQYDAAQRICKEFELLYRAADGVVENGFDLDDEQLPDMLLEEPCTSTTISCGVTYQTFVNSQEMNLFAGLWKNGDDFTQVFQSAERYQGLFQYLSQPDGIRLLSLLFTRDFPKYFTAKYAAEQLNMEAEATEKLLCEGAKLGIFGEKEALIGNTKTFLFSNENYGNGHLLLLISLAYEYCLGNRGGYFSWHEQPCLIKEVKRHDHR